MGLADGAECDLMAKGECSLVEILRLVVMRIKSVEPKQAMALSRITILFLTAIFIRHFNSRNQLLGDHEVSGEINVFDLEQHTSNIAL